MEFAVTKHAIKRYRERIDQCSKRDAHDRLMHAASISRIASTLQVAHAMKVKRIVWTGPAYRWCEVESLLLVCNRIIDRYHGREILVVLTVMRVPSDSEIRAKRKQISVSKYRKGKG